jgi:hypothetical protein
MKPTGMLTQSIVHSRQVNQSWISTSQTSYQSSQLENPRKGGGETDTSIVPRSRASGPHRQTWRNMLRRIASITQRLQYIKEI